jgi:hypothetical protein
MKRVLKITATNGGTTAKVRIEVVCREMGSLHWSRRHISEIALAEIADGVMQGLRDARYLKVLLSRQRVGR